MADGDGYRLSGINFRDQRHARLTACRAYIGDPMAPDGQAGEQQIAVKTSFVGEGWALQHLVAGCVGEIAWRDGGPVRTVVEFLDANDIGVELGQHRKYARRIKAPVAPDAFVDVVGRDREHGSGECAVVEHIGAERVCAHKGLERLVQRIDVGQGNTGGAGAQNDRCDDDMQAIDEPGV